jgi:hypothetical protein
MRKLFLLKLALTSVTLAASAAGTAFPNLTGNWKADIEKCTFLGPPPEALSVKITDDGTSFTLVQTEMRGGNPRTVELKLDKTGKETINKIGSMEVRTVIRIENGEMREDAVLITPSGKITRRAVVRVSSDGKTVTKDGVYNLPDGERREKVVLVKE